MEYKQVFARKNNQGIEGMEHKLEVIDDTPIGQRLYRANQHIQAIIDKTLEELLEKGIIDEAEGDCCSPV